MADGVTLELPEGEREVWPDELAAYRSARVHVGAGKRVTVVAGTDRTVLAPSVDLREGASYAPAPEVDAGVHVDAAPPPVRCLVCGGPEPDGPPEPSPSRALGEGRCPVCWGGFSGELGALEVRYLRWVNDPRRER